MAQSNPMMGGTIGDIQAKPLSPLRRRIGMRTILAGGVVAGVLGVATFFVPHKPAPTVSATPSTSTREAPPPRPAFTPAEEEYIRTLGPIHADVEHVTLRLTLGQLFYLTQDLDRAELKRRVDGATAAYQAAEKRLRALQPPTSLEARHNGYLAAIRLFQSSTAEVHKMFQDGREEEHLHAAYPMAQEGTDRVRELGHFFWPGEHPAH